MNLSEGPADRPKVDQVFLARDGKNGSVHALLLGVPPDAGVYHSKLLPDGQPGPMRPLALELPEGG